MEVPLPDPDLDERAFVVASIIAAYVNKHMFFELRNLPEAEQKAEIFFWKKVMAGIIEELG